jgi:hypothetical protein
MAFFCPTIFVDFSSSSLIHSFMLIFPRILKDKRANFEKMNPHLSYFLRSVCLRNRNALHNTVPFRILKLYIARYISLYILGLNCTVRRFLDAVLFTSSITFEITHYIFYMWNTVIYILQQRLALNTYKKHTHTQHTAGTVEDC